MPFILQKNPGRRTRNAMIRLGRLAYMNTFPFFYGRGVEGISVPSPRKLAQWAENGKIDAGPIPVVEAWRLEKDFETLGSLGIAVKNEARSVLLFSKTSLDGLDGKFLGVTDQTSTSVRLLTQILKRRYGVNPRLKNGFSISDEARLLIGDDALKPSAGLVHEFPYVFDLGKEWRAWRGLPFVFAVWVVRKNISAYLKEELLSQLEESLVFFRTHFSRACEEASKMWKFPEGDVRRYFRGFQYHLGDEEYEAMRTFREMTTGKYGRPLC